MSKARLVITAITVENRTVAEVVATYGVSRSWAYELLARYRDEGEAAFGPRPNSPTPHPTPSTRPSSSSSFTLVSERLLIQAASEAAATPYWTPTPISVVGHRAAADALRAEADRLLATVVRGARRCEDNHPLLRKVMT